MPSSCDSPSIPVAKDFAVYLAGDDGGEVGEKGLVTPFVLHYYCFVTKGLSGLVARGGQFVHFHDNSDCPAQNRIRD